jgi:outer membrane murein-binding lipoprotein Lpp
MSEILTELLLSLSVAAIAALAGIVWKFGIKISQLDTQARHLKNRIGRLESDHDKVMDRLYSVAKSRGDFVTRNTYNQDRLVEQALEAARQASDRHT